MSAPYAALPLDEAALRGLQILHDVRKHIDGEPCNWCNALAQARLAIAQQARIADLTRERDEARAEIAERRERADIHSYQSGEWRKALAASQAALARARGALAGVACQSDGPTCVCETCRRVRHAQSILSEQPDDAALRAVCRESWRAGSLYSMGGCNPADGPPWDEQGDKRMESDVTRVLGARGEGGAE